MKGVTRGAIIGALIAIAWLATTAGPEIAGQSPSYIIGWIGAPLVVLTLVGAGIGGLFSLFSRA